MNTEFSVDTQCGPLQPRRKTLAVVTSSMANTPRAELLSAHCTVGGQRMGYYDPYP